MQILIAEDNVISRVLLERTLQGWGHDVLVTCDGAAAWNALRRDDAPKLAILDWMMPEMAGVEVCRRVRALERSEPTYLILLSARQQVEDVVLGLDSGANDYVCKPFIRQELQSRVRVGERMVILQRDLADRVRQLEEALANVKQLQGLLPICSYCHKIRDDGNYWERVDTYMASHLDVRFSHGICPDCFEHIVLPELAAAGIDAPVLGAGYSTGGSPLRVNSSALG